MTHPPVAETPKHVIETLIVQLEQGMMFDKSVLLNVLRALTAARRDGWKPIESAPKEPCGISPQSEWHAGIEHGPVILLSFYDAEGENTCRDWRAHVGWWQPHTKDECSVCAKANTFGCWRFLADDGGHDIQPTRWRELPPPPTA